MPTKRKKMTNMNNAKMLTSLAGVSLIVVFSNLYSFTVPTLEGGSKNLSDYQGKKVLITILPTTRTFSTDSLLSVIDSLGTTNTGSLGIVAVPSFENGFTVDQKDSLLSWYRTKLSNSIVIADGLYTNISSGNQQHPLFVWLTNKDQNGHFDGEIMGIGQKYFIDEEGELFAVLGPEVKYGGTTVRKVLEQ